MANRNSNCRRVRNIPSQAAQASPCSQKTQTEPVMRRWPHPVAGNSPVAQSDSMLYYIYCALTYQNQLLADIKSLLEQLRPGQESDGDGLSEGKK